MCDDSDPAYLDRSETSVDPAEANRPTNWSIALASEHPNHSMHARHAAARIHIIASMLDSTDDKTHRRAMTMRDCRACPVIFIDEAGDVRAMLGSCRDRACPTCSEARSQDVCERIAAGSREWTDCRFVTLTLDHRGEQLSEMLDRLIRSYRRLRQTKLWSGRVAGSIATIEVTRNQKTNEWHAHLHVLTHGLYIPFDAIKAAWTKATGGATIVFLQRVNQKQAAAKYVAKYVSKPAEIQAWTPQLVREWATATKGRRLLIAAGDAHGRCSNPREAKPKPEKNVVHLRWESLVKAYREQCPHAIAFVDAHLSKITGLATYMADRLDGPLTASGRPPMNVSTTPREQLEEISNWVAGKRAPEPPPEPPPRRGCKPEHTPTMFETGASHYG